MFQLSVRHHLSIRVSIIAIDEIIERLFHPDLLIMTRQFGLGSLFHVGPSVRSSILRIVFDIVIRYLSFI